MFTRIYAAFGVLLIGGYLAATLAGWDVTSPEQERLPSNVRQSPGGYRSFHFWHSGFHGGK
ncbi:MAG TPA: hypothetical protein VGY55_10210 [Pirellulales bacterium]|jgi:hypothetical protein|nr:hypothetical protein [Pirellulales bacterium]